MATITDAPARLLPLAEELLENDYARKNLTEGAEKLRDAYKRAGKRRVHPAKDRKLRRQFEAAIAALDEGTAALAGHRRKPKRTGRKVTLTLLAVAGAGAAAVLATNEKLREQVLGSAKALREEIVDGPNDGGEDGGSEDQS